MPWSIRQALDWGVDRLRESVSGSSADSEFLTPTLDAEVLLAHCLNRSREFLLTHPKFPLPEEDRRRFQALIGRRARREPVVYITGIKEFWSLPFLVRPGVLIPRPETEILVQGVFDLCREKGLARPDILDVGTGCGNIAVALAAEMAGARVVATDVSPLALETARENARRNGVIDRVRFVRTSLLDGISPSVPAFDFIVSNPPYVPASDRERLLPEVREYEPGEALFVEGRGILFFQHLIGEGPKYLRPGGFLCFEIGFDQKGEVERLFRDRSEFEAPVFRNDLSGRPRTVFARRI
jgi:release factor glutamine methyltransferase